MMKKQLVFVDAETDGLYGAFLTVGMLAADISGREIERAYYGIRKENIQITDEWTKQHVLPLMGDYEVCGSEDELLEKVWAFWKRYEHDAYGVADVAYPVEARLLERCVRQYEQERKGYGPFPLLDMSSLLLARGIGPLKEREALLTQRPSGEKHNALYDVLVSAAVWREYFGAEFGGCWDESSR